MLGYLPDAVVFWPAVLGVVLAVMLRPSRLTLYLIAPALFRFLIWPFVAPLLTAFYVRLSFWEIVLLAPVAVLVAVLVAIKAMQGALENVYGSQVAVRVVAHAIIAFFRIVGRVLGFIFMWPIRAFKNRRNMDALLREWRRP
jgi:hypothetical protein